LGGRDEGLEALLSVGVMKDEQIAGNFEKQVSLSLSFLAPPPTWHWTYSIDCKKQYLVKKK
jgi:hypothetical protein